MGKRYCIICTFVVGVVERLRKGNQMKVLMVEIKSQHVVLPMNNPMNSSITNTRRRKQSIIRATKQRKIRLNPSPFMFTTPQTQNFEFQRHVGHLKVHINESPNLQHLKHTIHNIITKMIQNLNLFPFLVVVVIVLVVCGVILRERKHLSCARV